MLRVTRRFYFATTRLQLMTDELRDPVPSQSERMQCMEVWGGNCEVDRKFEMPGLHAWVYSRPHAGAEGGGDVYYLSSCASGRITRVLLADVSGHGAAVAPLAVALRELMRRNVNVVKQSRFVEGMNRQFSHLSASDSFATALVATFFQPTRRLTVCNAGHPPPLLYDASRSTWFAIEPPDGDATEVSGTPLGVHASARYPQEEVVLDRGDLVLLFSDAVTESVDREGRMLGSRGLLRMVRGLTPPRPADLLRSLIQAVTAHQPEQRAADDATIVLLEATSTTTRWSDNVLALFRLLRPASDRTMWRAGSQIAQV